MKQICGSDEYVVFSDMKKVIKEMDRRYYLVQNFQWEFSMLDHEHVGCIPVSSARLMFEAVFGARFSPVWWNRFLSHRPIRHAPLTFAEIEVPLCGEPPNLPERKHHQQTAPIKTTKTHIQVSPNEPKKASNKDIEKDVSARIITPSPDFTETESTSSKSDKSSENLELDDSAASDSGNKMKDTEERKNLKRAIKSRDQPILESSIRDYVKKKSDQSRDELLEKAKKLLEVLKCSKALNKAMANRIIAEIEETIDRIKKNRFDRKELSNEVAAANELLLRLRHIEKLRIEVLELKQSTIAELRSYKSPIPIVHNVMVATYLLLGVQEKETKKWTSVQSLLGKTGKEGLKRRIMTFKENEVSVATARRAQHIIGQDEDLESIRDVSAGAATFYVWAKGMIDEALHDK
uniref:uncharacterized protein LOC100182150 isoform X2 n=1 Tax=Ciona intestinalis TaxID=7719 RepID=UPI000EF4E138|nr:uncharacterized protein LOC100182150 isoform X2 [Ciona intestinalis]|eukprot:XP_026694817.1 uncharacterized protein LOC100182150 isoform X2 [Ciona intestinalis]